MAFRKIDQYEIGRGFGKWIKAIARNRVREELRKRYRYKGRIAAYANLVVDRLDAADMEEADDEDRARREALNECVGMLADKAAQVVRLHYGDRKKTEQIASAIGRSGGAVRTLLYRARNQLKDCLESKGVMA
jgi:RNA polymerase sigma-70 factor (ECF subfamily)